MPNDPPSSLSASESRDLRAIAGVMIPPDEELGIPGADDAIIFADITASLGRDIGHVQQALAKLSALAGGHFSELDAARQQQVAETFLARSDVALTTLGRVVLLCYYRDDRVMQSLGMEPRPPFPKGHTLEQGDWSLLDMVRNRPKLWRDAP